MEYQVEIPSFDELFDIPSSVHVQVRMFGYQHVFANKWLKRYHPCVWVLSFLLFCDTDEAIPPEMWKVKPKIALINIEERTIYMEYEDLSVFEDHEWMYKVTGDVEKFGKDFERVMNELMGAISEDAICRAVLVPMIRSYVKKTIDLTKEGVGMVISVAAAKIWWEREKRKMIEEAEEYAPPEEVPFRPPEVAPPELEDDLKRLIKMLKGLSVKYNMTIDELLRLIRERL